MLYAVAGRRLGTKIIFARRVLTNGAIPKRAADALRVAGYRIVTSPGIPKPDESAILETRSALQREQVKLAHDIAKGFERLLAPLRKRTYRDSFR